MEAQVISNGSLEGPTGSIPPSPWATCGGTPDTQILNGSGGGIFGINTPASHGNTYVGFVSTDWAYIEAIGQSVTLTAGMAYTGALDLYRSTLHSSWNGTGQCQIWGGTSCSNLVELLWSSGTITNLNNWQTYPLTLSPTMNHSYIIFVNDFNLGSGSMDYFCLDNIRLSASILPINILSFGAIDNENSVSLSWETNPTNLNERFEVEWSGDGSAFESVGEKVAEQGEQLFSFEHNSPQPGLNFYRLKALDANGGDSFSEIRQVTHAQDHSVGIFPNPSSGDLQIGLRLYAATEVGFRILNAGGQIVHAGLSDFPAGNQVFSLHLPNGLASGIYHLELRFGVEVEYHKFNLLR